MWIIIFLQAVHAKGDHCKLYCKNTGSFNVGHVGLVWKYQMIYKSTDLSHKYTGSMQPSWLSKHLSSPVLLHGWSETFKEFQDPDCDPHHHQYFAMSFQGH